MQSPAVPRSPLPAPPPLLGGDVARVGSIASAPSTVGNAELTEDDSDHGTVVSVQDNGSDSDSEEASGDEGGRRTTPRGGMGALWSALRGDDPAGRVSGDAVLVRASGGGVAGNIGGAGAGAGAGRMDLRSLRFVQCLPRLHTDQVVCLEFSPEGTLLASGDRDGTVAVWRTLQHVKESFDMEEPQGRCDSFGAAPVGRKMMCDDPWQVFSAHTMAITALAWSESHFLLSASKDASVRLWHAQRAHCLFEFRHPAPVTCVQFAPGSDVRLATGSTDQKLRVWNIKERRVEHWYGLPLPVTALCFTRDARIIIVGLEDAEVRFLKFDPNSGLEFYTQIECRNRRGVQRKGKKVTGIKPCVLAEAGDKMREAILVSTNDSRVRLCSLDTFLCLCKYKGSVNTCSPIAASMNAETGHVICGSEDKHVYVWRPQGIDPAGSASPFVTSRRILGNVAKKCSAHESFQAHSTTVTAAVFAPSRAVEVARGKRPAVGLHGFGSGSGSGQAEPSLRHSCLVTAGADGHIHVFENAMPETAA